MRISFAEAAFIRYFEPRYNKVYNTGFPHQRLKILKKLYDFDFAGIVVEASVEDHGMRLYSEKQSPNFYHIAKFDLHDPATRKSFFFAESLPLDKNRSILNIIKYRPVPNNACFHCIQLGLEKEVPIDFTNTRKLHREKRNIGNLAPLAGISASFVAFESLRVLIDSNKMEPYMMGKRGEFNFLTSKLNFSEYPKLPDCEWCGSIKNA